MTISVTYCTILSTNYLPKALALADSLRRHADGATLHILFTDIAHDEDLPKLYAMGVAAIFTPGTSTRDVVSFLRGALPETRTDV